MTVPRALLLALALLQAAGVLDVVRRVTCEQACREDGCGDPCTPDRDAPQCACHCPSSTTLAASPIATVTVVPASVAELRFRQVDQRPAIPDPREILHVPRQRVV